MDENGFDVFKATDRERINEALRMMDEWEKEEKEAADWDYEANEMDQYVNLPEHTRKLLDCLGMLQGTLNTYEVKDDKKKLEEALEFIERILKSDPDQTGNAEENLRVKLQQFEIIKEILEK